MPNSTLLPGPPPRSMGFRGGHSEKSPFRKGEKFSLSALEPTREREEETDVPLLVGEGGGGMRPKGALGCVGRRNATQGSVRLCRGAERDPRKR